jgi:hypothetical protein
VCTATAGVAPPHERLRASRQWGRCPLGRLHLLHLLPTLDVTSGVSREQAPNWLGLGGRAPAAALILGGR